METIWVLDDIIEPLDQPILCTYCSMNQCIPLVFNLAGLSQISVMATKRILDDDPSSDNLPVTS